MSTDIVVLAARSAASAVAAARPFVSRGRSWSRDMDEAAARAIETVLADLPGLRLVSCEGARDGVAIVSIPVSADANLGLYCDPVDGSTNAARGGPRAFSAVAISTAAPPWDSTLRDDQAVFSIGSQTWDVSRAFVDRTWHEIICAHLDDIGSPTATLNRLDNLALIDDLGRAVREWRTGSSSGYRPTLVTTGLTAVGDATLGLPFECDLEFGRVGLVEAQIASAIYSSWTGLLVSRSRLVAWPGGTRAYIDSYLDARESGDPARMARHFTGTEIEDFERAGRELSSVMSPLFPASFGPGSDATVAVAALSSPHDAVVDVSRDVFDDPLQRGSELLVDVRTLAHGASSRRTVAVPASFLWETLHAGRELS